MVNIINLCYLNILGLPSLLLNTSAGFEKTDLFKN